MNDTAALLAQLKIDRSPDRDPAHRRWWWLAAALALIGALALLWFTQTRAISVDAAVVSAADTGAGASLLDASGYVVARRQATVSSKITGKLQELYIEEGQRVAAGEVIARLDDTNARAAVDEARARVAQAQLAYDNARPIHARNIAQAAEGLISSAALDASRAEHDARRSALRVAQTVLQSAERSLDDTVVRAPFAGVITQKAAQPGEIVSPISAGGGFTRTGIGTLVDMDSLEIEVDVGESFINRVQREQPATARLNAYPDWEIPATVIAVIPTADRSKATVKVRVGLAQKDPRILPDMGARVSFLRESGDAASTPATVSVPLAAVQRDASSAERGIAYVINEDSRLVRRELKLSSSIDTTRAAVLDGLTAGERVAVGDFATLSDGARVSVRDSE